MTWVRIDDSFADDARIATAGAAASGALVFALCYSNQHLTDGWVPAAIVRRFLGGSSAEAAREAEAQLLQLKLVTEEARDSIPGYRINHDFVRLQPSRAQVVRQRRQKSLQKAEAGRLGGLASGEARGKQKRSTREAEQQAELKQTGSTSEPPIPVLPVSPKDKSSGAVAPQHATYKQTERFAFEVLEKHGNVCWADHSKLVKDLLFERDMAYDFAVVKAALSSVRCQKGLDRMPTERGGELKRVAAV